VSRITFIRDNLASQRNAVRRRGKDLSYFAENYVLAIVSSRTKVRRLRILEPWIRLRTS
jgi:hypothetical protein